MSRINYDAVCAPEFIPRAFYVEAKVTDKIYARSAEEARMKAKLLIDFMHQNGFDADIEEIEDCAIVDAYDFAMEK